MIVAGAGEADQLDLKCKCPHCGHLALDQTPDKKYVRCYADDCGFIVPILLVQNASWYRTFFNEGFTKPPHADA